MSLLWETCSYSMFFQYYFKNICIVSKWYIGMKYRWILHVWNLKNFTEDEIRFYKIIRANLFQKILYKKCHVIEKEHNCI